jgi:hypothetical protein
MKQYRFAMHNTWRPVLIIAIVLAVGMLVLARPRDASAGFDESGNAPDLTVTSAKYMYLPANTYPFKAGWYLVATVKNTSAFNINQPFKVFLATTDEPFALVLDAVTLGGLAAGASKGIPFPMPACQSTLSRRVHVDAQHQINESNENNNTLTWVKNCG